MSESNAADRFHQAPDVRAAVDTIIARLETVQRDITEARPPRGNAQETLDGWIARATRTKGRGPVFPYIGSGVGCGPLVELVDGSVKWDLINGIGVHMFGHSDPGMVRAAIEASLGDVAMEGNLQFNADSIAYAELLIEEAARGSDLRHAFITNSGAMANENALKVCQQKTCGRPRILAFEHCFMGRSTTMAQIGDSAGGRVGIPLNAQIDYMPFYDPNLGERSTEHAVWQLDQYLRRYPDQHSCFIFELVQGEGGFNVGPREFFLPLMQRCREVGIPVWDDEVQTFGRNTEMFYYDVLGLGEYVDIVAFGKMSQACGCLFTEAMAPRPGLLSGTFIGSSTAFTVGRAALDRLRTGGYYGPQGRIAALHEAFLAHGSALVERRPEWFPPVDDDRGRPLPSLVGGTGGMCRMTPFGGRREAMVKLLNVMFEEGVIAFYCGHGPYHVRFLPPVGVMEPQHFEPVFEIIERAMARVADEV